MLCCAVVAQLCPCFISWGFDVLALMSVEVLGLMSENISWFWMLLLQVVAPFCAVHFLVRLCCAFANALKLCTCAVAADAHELHT